MSAETVINLVINQKASFEVTFHIKSNNLPLDITDYTYSAKFKSDINTPDNLAVAFSTTSPNTANGSLSISLTPEQTADMQVGRYVYDVAITNNQTDFKTRIVEGRITVSGGVA